MEVLMNEVIIKLEYWINASYENVEDRVQFDLTTPIVDLNLDSLRIVEIIFHLESEFGVETDEDELADLELVGDIAKLFQDVSR